MRRRVSDCDRWKMSTRIEGIIDRLSNTESFDDIKWILGDSIIANYAVSIIDDHLKANVDFQSKAGLTVTVERIATGRKPCKYCEKREGKFTAPNIPASVWERHSGCYCYINYSGDGIRRTLSGSGKRWEVQSEETLEARKTAGIKEPTARELSVRKLAGLPKDTAGALAERKSIGAGSISDGDAAALNKTTGEGVSRYAGDAQYEEYAARQKNVADAIADRFGGEVRYYENISNPNLLNWNGERWQLATPGNLAESMKRYWGKTTDGIVLDVSDIPARTVNKRIETALNSAGLTKDMDIIIMRDGKIERVLKFKV